MSTRYNNRRIVKGGQKIAPGKLLPGMVLTFNYSEKGVKDPRPILLFLYDNNGILEGININYLNPTKLKKLFSVIEFKKGKLDEEENLVFLKPSVQGVQDQYQKLMTKVVSLSSYLNSTLTLSKWKGKRKQENK